MAKESRGDKQRLQRQRDAVEWLPLENARLERQIPKKYALEEASSGTYYLGPLRPQSSGGRGSVVRPAGAVVGGERKE